MRKNHEAPTICKNAPRKVAAAAADARISDPTLATRAQETKVVAAAALETTTMATANAAAMTCGSGQMASILTCSKFTYCSVDSVNISPAFIRLGALTSRISARAAACGLQLPASCQPLISDLPHLMHCASMQFSCTRAKVSYTRRVDRRWVL
eukprot:scaffold20177_cov75-Skeletonema_marinoi.AAC.1